MIKRYKYQQMTPYSLHDMTVNKIECMNNEIRLWVKDEWSKQTIVQEGSMIIEGVDFDCSNVLLLNKNGEYGNFDGQKLSIQEFLKKYNGFTFEIISDKYGYNMVEYRGFIYLKTKEVICETIEMIISIYHFGDIVYDFIK